MGKSAKRLQKEYIKLNKKPEEGVLIDLIEENIQSWRVTCIGPVRHFIFKFKSISEKNTL